MREQQVKSLHKKARALGLEVIETQAPQTPPLTGARAKPATTTALAESTQPREKREAIAWCPWCARRATATERKTASHLPGSILVRGRRSLKTLARLCRVLRPRRDRRHQALRCVGAAPVRLKNEGSPRVVLSGLHSTAWALAVYASPRALPGRDARLASGCWPGSSGWDWLPTGLPRKVSEE